jgi:hypothetical protein
VILDRSRLVLSTTAVLLVLALGPLPVVADLLLGSDEPVDVSGEAIDVPGYSIPTFADWNSDGVRDLVVGEGSGTYPGKVRIYLNTGVPTSPEFDAFFYAQSDTGDLIELGGG